MLFLVNLLLHSSAVTDDSFVNYFIWELEYVDFRCYRVYPSVFEVLQTSLLSEEDKLILQKRFAGAKSV